MSRFFNIRFLSIPLFWAGLHVVLLVPVQAQIQVQVQEQDSHQKQVHSQQKERMYPRHQDQVQPHNPVVSDSTQSHPTHSSTHSQRPIQNGQPPRLTVEESIRRGLEYNWRLQAARADAEEAEATSRQIRSGRLPVLRGQASYTRLSNVPDVDVTIPGTDTTFTILPVETNRYHAELSLEQPIFTGGRLNNRIEAADYQAEAAGYLEEQEQVEIAYKIRQAWWNLYRTQIAQETVEFSLTQVEEHLRDVRNRVEEGTALRTDLLNAETRRSEVLLEQIDVRSQVRLSRLELNRLIGLPSDAEPELAESEVTEPEERRMVSPGMDDLVDRALDGQPALNALSRQVQAGEAEIQATRAGWLPELHLVGRYIHARPNQYFFDAQDEFRATWEAGVSLRWNLWAGGQRLHETSRNRARVRSAEANLADMREQVVVNVARCYLELERATESIAVAEQSADSAEEAFHSIRLQFEEGAALSWQVLDAEQVFRQAQARQAEAIADYEIARAALLRATGQIW